MLIVINDVPHLFFALNEDIDDWSLVSDAF